MPAIVELEICEVMACSETLAIGLYRIKVQVVTDRLANVKHLQSDFQHASGTIFYTTFFLRVH